MTFDIDDDNKEISDSVKEYLAAHAFKTKGKSLPSFDQFIAELSNNPRLKKSILLSSDNSSVSDYLETRSSLSEEQRNISDIVYLASKQGSIESVVSCVSFTSFKSSNLSVEYKYANTPAYNTCSNLDLNQSVNSNSPIPCTFGLFSFSSCSHFKPDASLIARDSIEDNVFSLAKYRTITGSFAYIIYDQDLNVYQTLNYKEITDKDNSLDLAAIEIYNDFLSNQMMFETTSIDIPAKLQESSSKSSYLLSLIS